MYNYYVFLHFSAVSKTKETAPRTGFLHFFKQKEVCLADLGILVQVL